jgi:hypothetical protein
MPIFHTLVARLKAGERFMDGQVLQQVLSVPCVIKAVSEKTGYQYALNVLLKYKNSAMPVAFQQIVYPDAVGVFPWEEHYSETMRVIQIEAWKTAH